MLDRLEAVCYSLEDHLFINPQAEARFGPQDGSYVFGRVDSVSQPHSRYKFTCVQAAVRG